eukprot:jgi/Ulvmu1/11305/UM074_0020.1
MRWRRRVLLAVLQDRPACGNSWRACFASRHNSKPTSWVDWELTPFSSTQTFCNQAKRPTNDSTSSEDDPTATTDRTGDTKPNSKTGGRVKSFTQLGQTCRAYKQAVQRGNLARARNLMAAFHRDGGAPRLWMFDMLVNLHARRHDMRSAFAVQGLLRDHGLEPSLYLYNSLLVACLRAVPSGYTLPPAAVAAAEGVLREMAERGVQRDYTSYSIAMDVYAKAGMFPETEAQLELLRRAGHAATAKEYTSLIEACKRSNRAARAAHVLYTEMPAAGLLPDSLTWNALLGTYGRNGDIDGAYATWQEMMRRRIPPTEVTERELAEAFSSSPAFAADLVQQCKSFRAVLEAGVQPPPAEAMTPRTASPLLLAAFHLQGWLNWLRHGMRYPSAIPQAPAPAAATLAAADSGRAAHADSGHAAPTPAAAAGVLDVHRMNQAQARAAVLQQLHVLSAALPRAEVDDEHLRVVAGEVRYSLGHESSVSSAADAWAPDHVAEHDALGGADLSTSATVPSIHAAAGEHVAAGGERVAVGVVADPERQRQQGQQRPLRGGHDATTQDTSAGGAGVDAGRVHAGQDPAGGDHAATSDRAVTSTAGDIGCRSGSPHGAGNDTALPAASTDTADADALVTASANAERPPDASEGVPGEGAGDAQAPEVSRDWEAGGIPPGSASVAEGAAGGARARRGGGLVIIVGRGRSGAFAREDTSAPVPLDQNPLQLAVRDLLLSLQVGFEEVELNPGRLRVPRAELLRFAARSQHRGEEHAMMRRMLVRALALSVAATGLVQLMSDPTWARLFIFIEDHF